MNQSEIESGMAQMGFEMLDNGVLELPSSTPATYEFTDRAEYNPDGFEDLVEANDFSLFTPDTKQREDGDFYYYVDLMTDHYKKVHVRVWNDTACIYPREEQPDTFEFSRIVQAIEDAFGELEHAPETEPEENNE